MATAPDLAEIIHVTSKTLRQLRQFLDTWGNAPRELFKVREDVTRLSALLCSAQPHLVKVDTKHLGPPVVALNQELESITQFLVKIQSIITNVHGGPLDLAGASAAPTQLEGIWKRRWLLHKDELARSHKNLQDRCQSIVSSLGALTLEVSVDTYSDVVNQDNIHVPSGNNPGHHEHRQLPADTYRLESYYVSSDKQLIHEGQQKIIGRLDGRFQNLARSIRKDILLPKDALAVHNSPPGGYEVRDNNNELRFRRLEGVLSAMTASIGPEQLEAKSLRSLGVPGISRQSHGRRPSRPCRCICHSARPGRLKLLASQTALGAISFSLSRSTFSSIPCDVRSCTHARPAWARITYTFPAWLFQATVTAMFSDFVGTPEFVLRVNRRVPFDTLSIRTSLFGYVRAGETENIKQALRRKEGSITDARGDDGSSVLFYAICQPDQTETLRLLLQEGADLFYEDDRGIAPYHLAIQKIYASNVVESERNTLENLLPLGRVLEMADLSDLHEVVMGIRCVDIQKFLYYNSSSPVNIFDSQGLTPLYYAAARGDAVAVNALLEAGAQPNFGATGRRATPTRTPLHIACRNGHLQVVRLLLAAGADVHFRDREGGTALLGLMMGQSPSSLVTPHSVLVKIASELVRHGSDIHATNTHGSTSLHYACWANNPKLVDLFLNAGIGLDVRDSEGTTTLQEAIYHNSCEAATVMLQRGARYRDVSDYNGNNALHYIALCANRETMELFLRPGMEAFSLLDINGTNRAGQTPLQAFDARANATPLLRETFLRLLTAAAGGYDEGDSEGEAEEVFFDALENL